MRNVVAVVATACTLLPTAAAHAQTLRGLVMTEGLDRPVADAHVSVLTADGDSVVASRVSDNGRFLFDLPHPGQYRVRVEALGYATLVTAPVAVGVSTLVTIEVRLREDAIALEPLQVIAERVEPPFMREVRQRQEMGFGKLLTREDLDARFGSRLEDVLRDTGMWIDHVPLGNRRVPLVRGRESAGRLLSGLPCYAALYVNGARQFPTAMYPTGVTQRNPDGTHEFDEVALEMVDELFAFKPQDIEAIEVYRSRGETPALWAAPTADCGVVAVWLRSGYEAATEDAGAVASPRVALNIAAGSHRVAGTHAPAGGLAVGLMLQWRVGERFAAGLSLRRSEHTLAAESTARLMQGKDPTMYDITPGERPLSLYTITAEPRFELMPGGFTPVAALRVQLARRCFSVERSSSTTESQHFTSWGLGVGGAFGLRVPVGGALTLEAAVAQDRVFFGSYRFLDTPFERTSATWRLTSLQLGLVVSL